MGHICLSILQKKKWGIITHNDYRAFFSTWNLVSGNPITKTIIPPHWCTFIYSHWGRNDWRKIRGLNLTSADQNTASKH